MGNFWSLNPNDWFTDEEKGAGVNIAADPYKSVRDPYLKWLSGQIGQPGQSYTGQMVAPLSSQEQSSFDFLRKYGEGDYSQSPTYQNASKVVNDTLNNQYDPSNSPYYQAVKAESAKNLADKQKTIASDTAGLGNFFTGGRLKAQGEAAADSQIGLDKVLGELALQERMNQLNIIPQALGMTQNEINLPLQQATAMQTLGALPREIQQAQDTAAYNDWLRTNVEYPLQIAQMASGTQQAPLYQQNMPSTLYSLAKGTAESLPKLLEAFVKAKAPTNQSG